MDPISIGVSLLGGLFGSKNKAPTTTEKKEPWAPAQQYLIDNLATNKQLQGHYQQNPFNAPQRQAYQNVMVDQDNLRQNIAPGLMGFANNAMTGGYQRPQHGKPGEAGYGGAHRPDQTPGGLLSAGQSRAGPFSVAPSSGYGLLDWNAMNPFYQSPEQQAQAAQLAEQERLRQLAAQQQQPQTGADWYQNNMNGFGA